MMNQTNEIQRDRRVQATEKIWKYGVGMLALSLPFVFLARLVMLPIYVVFLAGIATVAVWMFGGGRDAIEGTREIEALKERLGELDERLANMETLSRAELQFGAVRRAAEPTVQEAGPGAASPPPLPKQQDPMV